MNFTEMKETVEINFHKHVLCLEQFISTYLFNGNVSMLYT